MNTLVIRADASERMGTGHVMRCLALAQGWLNECGDVQIVMSPGLPFLEKRLRIEGIQIILQNEIPASFEDAKNLISVAKTAKAKWLVVDGYHFGLEYQKTIKEEGFMLLFFDDYGHAKRYTCDYILNQNSYAKNGYYRNRENHTDLLLGCSYSCIRKEFWSSRGKTKTIRGRASRILLTLGGADADNRSCCLIHALSEIKDLNLEVVIIAGSGNRHGESLSKAVSNSPHQMQLKINVTDMVSLYEWADIAITAGGSTSWELAFMGIPSLMVVQANNQILVANSLEKMGQVINLGNITNLSNKKFTTELRRLIEDPALRRELSKKGQQLVDGHGVHRVIRKMILKNS